MDLNEKFLWERLTESGKPIILYGMGDGAEKVMNVMDRYNLKADGIMASDEFVRGHSFKGHVIKSYDRIKSEFSDFIILVCFGTFIPQVLKRLSKMESECEIYAPDVPVICDGDIDIITPQYIEKNTNRFLSIYNALADDLSKTSFENCMKFRLSGKMRYLFDCATDKNEILDKIGVKRNEVFVDAGAYTGDTIAELLNYTGGDYAEINAFEPDKKNFSKLYNKYAEFPNIKLVNAGTYSENTLIPFTAKSGRNSRAGSSGAMTQMYAIDNIAANATYIKIDVEGLEKQTLIGAENSLKNGAKLNIAIYHRTDDMFELPELLLRINPNYRMYLRHHSYIPNWDTNLYCV